MTAFARTPGKTGCILPTRAAVSETLKFRDYFKVSNLPQPPKHFGWWDAVLTNAWGMLGNDSVGDCVVARAMHQVIYWNAAQKRTVNFTDANAIAAYSDITGYIPGQADTDQGTDPLTAAKYAQDTGFADAAGVTHKIAGSVTLQTSDLAELALALWLFDGCSICVDLPKSAEDQFSHGQPWSLVPGSPSLGGHDTMGMGINSAGNIVIVTWGALQAIEPAWFKAQNNLLLCYLSLEALDAKGLSRRGYDKDALTADLAEVAQA